MRIDNEAGELRATLRSSAGCSVLVTILFTAAAIAVCCISYSVLLWFFDTYTGRTPPAILNQYSSDFPWQGKPDRIVLIVLGAWCLLWTWFAIGIASTCLRDLFGSDVIAAGADLSVTKSVGPFGRTRSFAVQSLRTFDVRRKDSALILRLDDGTSTELTKSGTAKERLQLRDLLRERLRPVGVMTPELTPHFEDSVQPDGTHVIRVSARARGQLVGCVGAFVAVWIAGTCWHIYRDHSFALFDPMSIGAVLLLAFVVFLVKAEESWQVKKGWFGHVRRFGPYNHRCEYDSANFSMKERRDSDGDLWFTLSAERDGRAEQLHSAMNDPVDVESLGRFLARESGFPFYGLREE
jgi:hypothetical protein